MCLSPDHAECGSGLTALADAFASLAPIDLSRRLEDGIPTYPTHPKFFRMQWCAMGDPARMNQFVLGDHTGTHLDAPSHFVSVDDPRAVGIDALPLDRFMGRALKLTFGPFEPENATVDARRIRDWEASHLPIGADDIVLIDFRWGDRWLPGEAGAGFLDRWPGLSADAAAYLAERRVKLVGTDCISLDPGDGGGGRLAAHYTLLPEGILILENAANLARLDEVSFFMAMPLKLGGGTGSPVRAVGWNRRPPPDHPAEGGGWTVARNETAGARGADREDPCPTRNC